MLRILILTCPRCLWIEIFPYTACRITKYIEVNASMYVTAEALRGDMECMDFGWRTFRKKHVKRTILILFDNA